MGGKVKTIEGWIGKAEKDLEDAKFNLENERLEVAAFLSHQAAEKALKALYIMKFERLWRIHDLEQLCLAIKAGKKIVEISRQLNPHYIETRYPLETDYTREIAENAFGNAERVLRWVKEKLKKSKKA